MSKVVAEVCTGPGPISGDVGKLPTVSVRKPVSEKIGGRRIVESVSVGTGTGTLPVTLAIGLVEVKLPVVFVQSPVSEKAGGVGAGAVRRASDVKSVAVVLQKAIEPLVKKGIAVVTTSGIDVTLKGKGGASEMFRRLFAHKMSVNGRTRPSFWHCR